VLAFEYQQFYQHLQKRIRMTGQWIEKKLFNFADSVVFVSALEMQSAQVEGLDARQHNIIYNGVDEYFYCAERRHVAEGPISLVFVGSIHRKEKGFSFLIDALKKYNKEIDVTVVSGYEIEHDFPSNIHLSFVRPMDAGALAKLFQKHDIYLLTSAYDSFSITAAEAMASGAVPIVTSTTGIAELISHGINGFIIEYGDSGRLCSVISMLQNDRSLLNEISKNTQTTIAHHTWMRVAQEYDRMYQCL
jgi:glycosyltransferase involved in cell wall biosynthesis